MNPHPAAAANMREVLPGIARGPPPQSTSCTTYSLGKPQRLIDLPGLLGLLDVTPSPGGSGSVIQITGCTSLAQYLPAGRQRRPPRSWSLKDYCGGPVFKIFAVYANFPLVGQVRAFRGRFTQTIYEYKAMKLPPTGTSNHISADSGARLQVKIDATKNKAEELCSHVLDWVHSPMSDKCNTVSIQTSKGIVDVVCALMSEAVEVGLRVSMCIPSELCSSSIYGSVTARTDMFDPKITIFATGVKSAINIQSAIKNRLLWWCCAVPPVPHFLCPESYRRVDLPLVRGFLVVPIQAMHIEFEGELTILGESKTLSVTQSIRLDAEDITTPWVKHGECYTSMHLFVHRPR
ncbi:hypothetical protein VPH35_054971 [Triticum aestivum]